MWVVFNTHIETPRPAGLAMMATKGGTLYLDNEITTSATGHHLPGRVTFPLGVSLARLSPELGRPRSIVVSSGTGERAYVVPHGGGVSRRSSWGLALRSVRGERRTVTPGARFDSGQVH